MPEGHSLHRAARLQTKRFVGPELGVSSPQGRFSTGADQLDGHRLEKIEAHGKHLFYRWSNDLTLHVHLGLFGRFRTHVGSVPPPTDGTRLALSAPEATLYLSGPTDCSIVDPDEERHIRGRLGPDPLSDDGDEVVDRLADALRRRPVGIGAALLDQKVIAGIGNVYRAELLFLAGLDPFTPSKEVPTELLRELWLLAKRQLRQGERAGRIVTVQPSDVGAESARDVPRTERLYVYKRLGLPCRRCGTEITCDELAGRTIWWCPSCQSGGASRLR